MSFGGQLLGSLIVRTVNRSLPHTSAKDTRFFSRRWIEELTDDEESDWFCEDEAPSQVVEDQYRLLFIERGDPNDFNKLLMNFNTL